jgi:hypothetical protein
MKHKGPYAACGQNAEHFRLKARGLDRCLNVVKGVGDIEIAALGNTAKITDKELTVQDTSRDLIWKSGLEHGNDYLLGPRFGQRPPD